MLEFLIILKEIILPVFMVMICGYVVQKKFSLDLSTIARVNIYLFVPSFIFVRLYSTDIPGTIFVNVMLFLLLYVIILYIISIFVARLTGFEKSKRVTFSNSIIFYNSGNYGVPVNDLVFRGDPFAMSIQVLVLMFQNIFLFSYGVFSLQSLDSGKLKALLGYFKMPVMYAMFFGLLFNWFDVPVSDVIWIPANYIADGMIALALLMLGMQVAQIKLTKGLGTVYVSLFIRLIVGPLIALVLIKLFGITGILAQALLISSAMPTSVNSSVIAQEYKNHPEYAAQIVLFSTLLSAGTVSFFIYLARLLF